MQTIEAKFSNRDGKHTVQVLVNGKLTESYEYPSADVAQNAMRAAFGVARDLEKQGVVKQVTVLHETGRAGSSK